MSGRKRAFDLIVTVAGLPFALPLMAFVAVVIAVADGYPVLFRQKRVGHGGVPFSIVKFRTMVRDAEASGGQLTVGNDARLTRTGCWLRRTKLDELPQLFNVLKGEMSLVGPRPEVPRYVAFYTGVQRRVLGLRPGITDPASIVFRDESRILARYPDPQAAYVRKIMPRKILLNLAYARRRTVASDIAVLLRTIFSLCR